MARKKVRIRTHPGEILQEEFLIPHSMSGKELADAIGVPPNRITDIVRERRGITADTALRLSKFFGVTANFWMNLQNAYDLSLAESQNDYTNVEVMKQAS